MCHWAFNNDVEAAAAVGSGLQFNSEDIMIESEDPLEAVPSSEVGGEDLEQSSGSRGVGIMSMTLDNSINLQLTADGIRKLLNRPPGGRRQPLLKIICEGCGLSTHDADPLLADDWLELLGWRCVSGAVYECIFKSI